MAKRNTELQEIIESLKVSFATWERMLDIGCHDPFWADGTNMNLVRNHIIFYKGEIADLCKETHTELPSEYYIPTPPEVDNNYMASKYSERYKKLINQPGHEGELTTKKVKYNTEQLTMTLD